MLPSSGDCCKLPEMRIGKRQFTHQKPRGCQYAIKVVAARLGICLVKIIEVRSLCLSMRAQNLMMWGPLAKRKVLYSDGTFLWTGALKMACQL